MHASSVLQKCLSDVLTRMHAMRVQVLLGAVQALLASRRLVLMELARAWPGAEKVRAPLKRLDRLLSNPHLQGEMKELYAAMARWLVRSTEPVIVVDWSALKQDESLHVLRAGLVLQGRTVTVFEQIYPQGELGSPRAHRRFLRGLKQVLPEQTRPILLTDAGFRCPWFREVEALGWHWIGRVRNHLYVRLPGSAQWRFTRSLLMRERRLTAFGTVHLAKHQSFACQLLRYCRALRGRKRRTHKGRDAVDTKAARGMREPWLLAYSNSLQSVSAARIAACYGKRMQIEQSFRDLKSGRYGCALRYSLTRTATRMQVLLLLHALASFVAWLYGLAVTHAQQITHCAVRIHTPCSHYSLLRIGWEAVRRTPTPSLSPTQIIRLATTLIPIATL
jgi:hypothetical protein